MKDSLKLTDYFWILRNIPAKMIPKAAAPLACSVTNDACSDVAFPNVHRHQAIIEDINPLSAISGPWNLFYVLGSAVTHFGELLHQYHKGSVQRVEDWIESLQMFAAPPKLGVTNVTVPQF